MIRSEKQCSPPPSPLELPTIQMSMDKFSNLYSIDQEQKIMLNLAPLLKLSPFSPSKFLWANFQIYTQMIRSEK